MLCEKLLKEVEAVERIYGTVLNAPDEIMKPIADIAIHLPHNNRVVTAPQASGRSEAITKALNRIDTSQMTADKILDYLNLDPDVTFGGARIMSSKSIYNLLENRGLPYKRKRRSEYSKRYVKARSGHVKG